MCQLKDDLEIRERGNYTDMSPLNNHFKCLNCHEFLTQNKKKPKPYAEKKYWIEFSITNPLDIFPEKSQNIFISPRHWENCTG